MLAANHPSSSNNVLLSVSDPTVLHISINLPRFPHTSPLFPSSLRMFCRCSTALWKCSCVRRMLLIFSMAWIEFGFARSACSYDTIASSRLPNNSAKLPVATSAPDRIAVLDDGYLTYLHPNQLIHSSHLLGGGPLLALRCHTRRRRTSGRTMVQLHACWRGWMMGGHVAK